MEDGAVWSQLHKLSPYHARVGVKTLMGLLETRACKFLLVDVRPFTDADFVDGTLGIGETDVNGSLLPVTPRILSPRVSSRIDRESGGVGAEGASDGAQKGGEGVGVSSEGNDGGDRDDTGDTGDTNSATPGQQTKRALRKTLSLPREFRGAIRLPYDLVGDVLSSKVAWEATFPHVKCPDTFTILVLLGENEEQECRAASCLNSLGYQRSLCVKGSIHALLKEERDGAMDFGKGPDVTYITRDALATLLMESSKTTAAGRGSQHGPAEVNLSAYSVNSDSAINGSFVSMDAGMHAGSDTVSPSQQAPMNDFVLIDVRRKDEVILYGAIRGAKHVPVDQLASALAPSTSHLEFEKLYHFPKPDKNKLLVFCSRAFSRATWAAHLAMDAGYARVCVYGGGVCGWNVDPAVDGYARYGLGDAPPSPISAERETVDYQRGYAELADLLARTGLT